MAYRANHRAQPEICGSPVLNEWTGSVLMGLRGSAARLDVSGRRRTASSAVALFQLDGSRSTFEAKPFSWSYSDHIGVAMALGAGYAFGGAFEVGPLVTTDASGSGFFLRFGADGEVRQAMGAGVARGFGQVPTGYRFRLGRLKVDTAVVPSIGDASILDDEKRFSGRVWLRERARIRFWHVAVELEHGRALSAAVSDSRVVLCASGDRVPIVSCTTVESFATSSLRDSSFREVAVSIGFGALSSTVRTGSSSDMIRLPR